MKEIVIEELAYMLKHAKENNQPQPIFFLGAGASKSGNIPLAREIINRILTDYSENPFIKKLPVELRTYAKLMDCLLPAQRDELLKGYIRDAKINVTHIYLAQLLCENYVDYVLTVNFDNLMLRALALYNIFPATYDMAILQDLTTTTFKGKSVVYLHGQNHGLWLLNTKDEMAKVQNIVPRIFDSIKNERPWIFIGYSGEDPIFEHIKKLGRFDNGLYWVSYNNNNPKDNVQEFLSKPNTNAYVIKGYDSDSFMVKLTNELGLGQPNIVSRPFTALKDMLNEIMDIDDKEHFKGVKKRLEISKKEVEEAVQQYEFGKIESRGKLKESREIDLLKKEIISLIVTENYDEKIISDIERRATGVESAELQSLLASFYYDWGTDLGTLARTKEGEEAKGLFRQAFEKYQKAVEIKPDKEEAWYNWGTDLATLARTKGGAETEGLFRQAFEKYQNAVEIKPDDEDSWYAWGAGLSTLARTKEGEEAEGLFNQAFEKYQKAIEIKPHDEDSWYAWGTDLCALARIKDGEEAEKLFNQAFEKYQKAIEIKPDRKEVWFNWGTYLGTLARDKEREEAEGLFNQAFEKYKKAVEIKPDDDETWYNWGTDLGAMAKTKEGKEAEGLFNEAFEKYKQAVEIKPNDDSSWNNWGTDLCALARTKEGAAAESLFNEAFEKYHKAYELNGDTYNLGCLYALKENRQEALYYLDLSLKNKLIEVSFVEKDTDWAKFLDDPDFIAVLDKYK